MMTDTPLPNIADLACTQERPIVIFGGSFDPPHRRHVEIAQGVDAILKAKQLLVIPARQNPQRTQGPAADTKNRLAMCNLAFAHLADTVVLPYEIEKTEPSFTIDTVQAIVQMQARGEMMKGPLRLLIGSDQALNFSTWKDWRTLFDLAKPVVVLRPPHTRVDWPVLLKQHMDERWAALWLPLLMPIEPVDSSSTRVREAIARGESIDEMVPASVANYIRSAGLYATATRAE